MDFNSKHKSSEIERILDSVGGKQDAITDLEEIRQGAAKGATALQEHQPLKTINGESIVGEGDITISGGSGESYAGNYPIYRFESNSSSLAIQPNTFTILKYITAYIISLYPPADNDIVNEYIFAWYSHPSGNSLSLPSSIIWANDDVLIPEDYNTYIISIIDNVAVYIKVEGNIYNVTHPGGGGDN